MKIKILPNGHYQADVYIKVKMWLTNNIFVKEICCLCKGIFDANSMSLYEIEGFGYICYDCITKLDIMGMPNPKKIAEIQNGTLVDRFGEELVSKHKM